MRRIAPGIVCGLLLVALIGCAKPSGPSVSGEVAMPTEERFTAGSTLLLRIADVSSARPALLAEETESLAPGWEVAGTRRAPKEFTVPYDKDAVVPQHKYVLWAQVSDDKRVLAASTPVPVITRGAKTGGLTLSLLLPASLAKTPVIP